MGSRKHQDQDSLDPEFDTRAQGSNGYKPRNGGYESYSAYGGYGSYHDEQPNNRKQSREERNKKREERNKKREQSREKEGKTGGFFDKEGEGSKLLKNIFGSLSKVMDSDDKTSSVLNAFSSIFKGGSVADIFADVASKDNKPIIQLLDKVLNVVRGGALPYENLITGGSVLQYFLDSDVGRKMLPNVQVDRALSNDSGVDVDEAKRMIKALEKEIAWKNSIGGKLDRIRDENSAEKKIAMLASIYMDGDNPVEDAQRGDKGVMGVLLDMYGGKYKFAEGATFNVVPPNEMRNQFMQMIKDRYNVEKRGAGYVVQSKKDFKERAHGTAKSIGEKLGGFAQVYDGGNPDNLVSTSWYYSLLQAFPLLYLFIKKDGGFGLPEGAWGWGMSVVGLLLFVGLFIFGAWNSVTWLYRQIIVLIDSRKKKTNEKDNNNNKLNNMLKSFLSSRNLKAKKKGRSFRAKNNSRNSSKDSD